MLNCLKIGSVVLLLSLGACSDAGPGETGGTLLGGVGGALIGAQFGSGTGQLVATAAGTLAGAYAGREVGRRIDNNNNYCLDFSLYNLSVDRFCTAVDRLWK